MNNKKDNIKKYLYNNHELLDLINKSISKENLTLEEEITERYYIKYINIKYKKKYKNFKELESDLET